MHTIWHFRYVYYFMSVITTIKLVNTKKLFTTEKSEKQLPDRELLTLTSSEQRAYISFGVRR